MDSWHCLDSPTPMEISSYWREERGEDKDARGEGERAKVSNYRGERKEEDRGEGRDEHPIGIEPTNSPIMS